MAYDLLNLYNLDPDENMEDNLRLALMFKSEVDEATRAYMEILQITIDNSARNQEDVTQAVKAAINAALLTGIRAYRGWLQEQGIDVQAVEVNSGKDIPPDMFRSNPRWPL
jgi:hypothetical protein